MKVAIFDSNFGKFTNDMIGYWQKQGHEVRMERGYNPELVKWGELIWFDLCDNNIKQAMYPDDPNLGYDLHQMDLTGKTIVCRPIDIDVWTGFQNDVDWDLVDHTIFIAPHIQELANRTERLRNSKTKQHVIPCGVDLAKWTFKKRQPGNKIAWVCERWASKGVNMAIQLMMMLPKEYELHALGVWHDYAWEEAYARNMFETRLKGRVFITEGADNVDEWLDDKNYILSTSTKEAFGFSIAEAMAKGIKPIVHTFYGGEQIWPDIVQDKLQIMAEMIQSDHYDSEGYAAYLVNNGYTLNEMMHRIDREVIHG